MNVCSLFDPRDRSISRESQREECQRCEEWENAIGGKQLDRVQGENLAASATERVVDKHNRPLLLQRRRSRLTEEDLRQEKSPAERVLLERKVKERAKTEVVRIRRATIGILPYVKNYKSELGCKVGDKCLLRRIEADGWPSKKCKKVVEKDQLPY